MNFTSWHTEKYIKFNNYRENIKLHIMKLYQFIIYRKHNNMQIQVQ